MPDVLRVKCVNCSSTLKAPPKFHGKRVKCPKCGHTLQIPRSDAPEEPEILGDDAFEDDEFGAGGVDHYENFGADFGQNEDYEDYEDYGEPDEFEQAYGHRSAPPPVARKSMPEPKPKKKRKRRRASRINSGTFDGMFSIDGGVIGGLLMMLIAAVWFFWGLSAGIIFFYPPVLFIIGLVAVIRSL
jgi:ribosomal protein S27AE